MEKDCDGEKDVPHLLTDYISHLALEHITQPSR